MVGRLRVTLAVGLAIASAACNRGDSDNVMGSSANALTPAQVDLALGPELTGAAGNQLDSSNEAEAVDSANAAEAAGDEDALDEAVPDEPADQAPTADNNNAETDGNATE